MATIQPESILHIARRVIRRNVQRVEIIVFSFDLGPVQNGEAHGTKQVLNLPLNLRYGMQRAGARRWRRNRKIEPFAIEAFRHCLLFEAGFACLPGAFKSLFRAVNELAPSDALFRRKLADVFTELREYTLAAKNFHADCLQFIGSRGGVNSRQCAV